MNVDDDGFVHRTGQNESLRQLLLMIHRKERTNRVNSFVLTLHFVLASFSSQSRSRGFISSFSST